MHDAFGCVGGRLVLRSTESETVELNDNMFLSPKPIGGTLGSYSTISANAEARTPTSKFDFDSYVNYNKYFGPGASTLPVTENLSYGFKGHYETYRQKQVRIETISMPAINLE